MYDDFLEYENNIYKIGEPFDSHLYSVMQTYDLKNYMHINNYDEWAKLPTEDKLEYCYSMFDALSSSEFAVFKQVSLFEKLIHLDFEHFLFINVIECMFLHYDEMSTTPSTFIPFNPFIPKKHYCEHIEHLKQKSGVGHLQIPLDNTADYFKELFHLWFLHKHEKKTAYAIANEYYDLDKQKQISRSLKAVQNLYNSKA